MYGLIGKNISTSLSPKIHTMGFEALGLQETYMLIQPEGESLEAIFDVIKHEKINGFNVTVPYKTQIMALLDGLDDSAKMAGAVNVVKLNQGQFIGYNTDGDGYVYALKYNEIPIKDRCFLICGAGGAARGIGFALAKEGAAAVDFMNRTVEKAEELSQAIQAHYVVCSRVNPKEYHYDVVINAISGENNLDLNLLSKETIISDINYRPHVTPFLEKARKLGFQIHFGLDMLIYQALFAEEIWTGQTFKDEDIKRVAGKIRQTLLEG